MSNDWTKEQAEGWNRFMKTKALAAKERDGDQIRQARSEAWTATFDNGGSVEDAIAAANAAELGVRQRLGIRESMDASKLATDGPHIFPVRRTVN